MAEASAFTVEVSALLPDTLPAASLCLAELQLRLVHFPPQVQRRRNIRGYDDELSKQGPCGRITADAMGPVKMELPLARTSSRASNSVTTPVRLTPRPTHKLHRGTMYAQTEI
jgi:hypothetical protein